ncbi:MAG: AMP-binding protein [Parachlamydiaceae bacterium]|nr:AMP-binding protein [Parachlamydiaceae bacterium]
METSDIINWKSPQSHILLNPRMPLKESQAAIAVLKSTPPLPGHIWLSTSGSSGTFKFVALSKKAILISAAAVNRHLESHPSDIWMNALPTFHIGGLSILARAYLKGEKVVKYIVSGERWNPQQFAEQMVMAKVSLTALVPTQIFDIVKEKIHAPASLRAAVIGGGALSETVYEQAINLGWKLLPSYGSTECASQVATAPMYSWENSCFPLLQPLDHVKISLNNESNLKIYGESLLSYYGILDLAKGACRLQDPKIDGWLTTEDRVVLKNNYIQTVSRKGNFVKIGGESVDLSRLDTILDEVRLLLQNDNDMSIFTMPDDRLGHVIHLAIASENDVNTEALLKKFHDRVHPYERIRQVHYVNHISRTSLNKVIRHQI